MMELPEGPDPGVYVSHQPHEMEELLHQVLLNTDIIRKYATQEHYEACERIKPLRDAAAMTLITSLIGEFKLDVQLIPKPKEGQTVIMGG